MKPLKIQVDDREYAVISLPGRPIALLDRTVAEIYEMKTWRVNEAVKRNPEKFPPDFFFQLTQEEFDLVADWGEFENIKHTSQLPKAFTHLGCNMLATVLKSKVAIHRSIEIIRAFTALESGDLPERWRSFIQQEMISKLRSVIRDELGQALTKHSAPVATDPYRPGGPGYVNGNGSGDWKKYLPSQYKANQEEEEVINILAQEVNSQRAEIDRLQNSLQETLSRLDTQANLIGVLTGRLHQSQQEIEEFKAFIGNKVIPGERLLEQVLDATPSPPIDKRQVRELRETARDKAGSRKQVMRLWADFKRRFDLDRYQELPQDRFDEAIDWIDEW